MRLKEKIKNKKTSTDLQEEINELKKLLLKATTPKEPETVKEPVKEPVKEQAVPVKEQPVPEPVQKPTSPIPIPRKLVYGGTFKPALW